MHQQPNNVSWMAGPEKFFLALSEGTDNDRPVAINSASIHRSVNKNKVSNFDGLDKFM